MRTHFWYVAHNGVPDHMDRGREAVNNFTDYVAEELEDRLGENAPVDDGDLARSFYNERLGASQESGGVIEYKVASDEPQAEITRTGSGMFNIKGSTGPLKPTDAGALVFFWKRLGIKTAWKGNITSDEFAGEFYRWAVARGMQPFFKWPKGQAPNLYVNASILETYARVPDLAEKAFQTARAGK